MSIINGSGGNDLLIGGEGISTISGGGGNDIIIGGGGKDTLTGGAGNDIFLSAGDDGIDTITDAENGDKIVFNNTTVTGTAKAVGRDLYQLGDVIFQKQGNDLVAASDSDSGAIIKNFFKSTYDPKADYTFMGITIPKLVDLDGDGIDDNAEKNAANVDVLIKQANAVFAEAGAASLIDPLIIDLSGNGIALNSWQTATALFDLDGNGTKENTGWTKANGDDVFLVVDKNSNGNIDNVNEMFGNPSVNGFAELAKYDSNKDNLINSTDTQFSLLKLWNDKDADGTVDAGEMTTLSANKVTEISLNKYASIKQIDGNLQTAVSTVTINGVSRNIHEINFGFETPTVFTNPDFTLPSTFKLSVDSLLLPYSRGYGSLYSWQAAMTLDPTLLAMAKDLAATQPKDFYLLGEKFEAFLFRWAGVENVTAANVYTHINGVAPDARKIAFLEKITGENFIFANITSSPPAMQAWELFFNEFLNKFLVQGTLASAFPKATYDFATDTLKFNDTLDNVIASIKAQAAGMDANSFVNYAFYAQNILKLNKGQF
ncbi:MAG: hypothetical protein ABL867_11575, partial [Rickettsiales bacterium]